MSDIYEIRTSIDISAKAEDVWKVLQDFKQYPEWNPFIISIEGGRPIGSKLSITIQPVGARSMDFQPTLLVFDDNREIRWVGKVWPGMMFDGEHSLMISERKGGGVTFIHSEKFRGIFVPLLKKNLRAHTKPGFEKMNMALKALCEKGGTIENKNE